MSNLTYKNRCTCLSMKVTALHIITNNLSAQPGNAHPDSRCLCVSVCVLYTGKHISYMLATLTAVVDSLHQMSLLLEEDFKIHSNERLKLMFWQVSIKNSRPSVSTESFCRASCAT